MRCDSRCCELLAAVMLGVILVWTLWPQRTLDVPTPAPSSAPMPDDPLLALALAPWTGDLDEILERGLLRVAIPYGLTTYFIDGPTQRGLSYERVVAFEAALKRTLGARAAHLTLVIIPTNLSRLLPTLIEGRADLAVGNLTRTAERSALVDFSDPFVTGVHEVLVTGPAAPEIRTFDDLLSSRIHVRRSSSFFEHLSHFNAERMAAGAAPLPVHSADENLSGEDLLEQVATGVIPATIADEPIANLFGRIFEDLKVHEDLVFASDREIAWAMRHDSPRLKALVNAYVPEARRGSMLGNVLIDRYLNNIDWAKNALAGDGRQRFQRVANLMQRHAVRHGFDWRLIAAQGYQESGLRQDQRSPAGAIGVMQVMPATARDPNVAIPDIHLLEPNIQAGVKYLALLRDRYFNEPELSALDRTLFSLAAYNAGPSNIARARQRAVLLGLNPNVWFDNTEIAAAQVISGEPVVYVRNIYKYYLAYKLVSEGGSP
ncbi:hypothetical protein CKO25_14175 [Thiocapsa imhoffii]|uniref:Solute-binding protein family 3/N-terminal domain-containing protein n=1 Tax=Thiocapsa imhoffii TaxID=382777 RepID=A0A9X0WJP0_9GAMM|nr:transporter substrate-binding domain-containing protein [Thiocapsa imhoffii]MBK1645778.1 hypothetical protein [Thiocapsa imhoffii]